MKRARPTQLIDPGESAVDVLAATLPSALAEAAKPRQPDDVAREHLSRFEWERELLEAPDVGGTMLCVLLALGTYMSAKDGRRARPGHARLARQAGLGESTVRRHLAAAVRTGWLATSGHHGGHLSDGTAIALTYAATRPLASERWVSASTDPQRAVGQKPTARYGTTHRSLDVDPPLAGERLSRSIKEEHGSRAPARGGATRPRGTCRHGRSAGHTADGFPVCQECEVDRAGVA